MALLDWWIFADGLIHPTIHAVVAIELSLFPLNEKFQPPKSSVPLLRHIV